MAQTSPARRWAEALEPRLLHSADLTPLLLGSAAAPLPEHQATLETEATAQATAEIVFIDATLPDAALLLADLQAQQAAGRPLDVVLLQKGDDGLAVIGSTLAERSGLTAIHLIGHGSDGALQLGATRLDATTTLQRAGDLAAWRNALAPGADLLIYGCDVAAGDAGRSLVADLAALTGADVAASDDLTGAAAAGGDWLLEVHSGRIETLLAPGVAAQQAFAGTLRVHLEKVESNQSSGNVSSLRWEHDVNNSQDRLLVVQLVLGNQILANTAVSYGGQALTLLAVQESALLLGTLRTEVWFLVAPDSGKHDVVVTSNLATRIVGGSIDFKLVDQSSPFGPVVRNYGSGSNVSLTVAATSNDIVLDVVGSQGVEDGGFGSNQNKTWEQSQGDGSAELWGSASREDGAASVTMSQTLDHNSGSQRWAAIAVAVKKTGTNSAPVITSNGGGASAALVVAENTSAVTTVAASDPENSALTYSLAGGADAARFSIDAASGQLRFVTAPNAEVRNDANADNVYEVTLRVSDGLLTDTQALAVTVGDVNEFAVGTPADNNAAADQVLENAAIGSTVGITTSASDADASNNTVAYSLTDNAGGRFSIDAASGVVRVAGAIDRETAASHSIVVLATSSDGSSRTRAFTVAVSDSDEFDTSALADIDSSVNLLNETAGLGSLAGITARADDNDATNNTITYTLDNSAGGLFTVDGASGVLRLAGTLDYETATSHLVVVRASSADGSTATASFTVTVANVNEQGVGTVTDSNGGSNQVAENLPAGQNTGLTAQASDAGDSVSYSLFDDAGGRFAIDTVTGVVRTAMALDAEAAGSWSVMVLATSSDTSTTTQAFTIGVLDSNEFAVGVPVDTDGAGNGVDENATIGSAVGIQVSASDADATGSSVTYSLTADAGGRFANDAYSGVVRVVGGLDFETAASHQITVQASSADGSSASSNYTIAIGDADDNRLEFTSGSAYAVLENSAAVATLLASDGYLPAPGLSYSIAGGADAALFNINPASGQLRFAQAPDFEAPLDANRDNRYHVNVMASDGSRNASRALVVTVIDHNEAPLLTSHRGASEVVLDVVEGDAAVSNVAASDPEGSALAYRIVGGADGSLFTVNAASGALRWLNASDFEAPADAGSDNVYNVAVAASDGANDSLQNFSLRVGNRNEAPLPAQALDNASASQDTRFTLRLPADAFTDVDAGDTLTWSATLASGAALPTWLTFDATSRSFSGTPTNADVGSLTLRVLATDVAGASAAQDIVLVVVNVNDAPTAATPVGNHDTIEDSGFSLSLPAAAFADIDTGETLVWSATLTSGAPLPGWLTFDATSRSFSGTPTNAEVGSLALRVLATDAAGASATQDFVLTIVNINDTPLATALPAQQATEGSQFSFVLPALALVDPDSGDSLRFSASLASGQPLPSWLSFDAATRSFSGTPAAADRAPLVVRITATDISGAQAATDLHIAIQPLSVPTLPVTVIDNTPVMPAPEAAPPAVPVSAEAVVEEGAPAAVAPAATLPTAPAPAADLLAATPVAVETSATAGASPAAAIAPPPPGRNGGSSADSVLAPAVLPQFSALTVGGTAAAWLHSTEMQRNYEALQQQLEEAAVQRRAALASSVAISGGLSIGYVVWLVRGGVLMSSMLSPLPAWKMLDPLPVLAAARGASSRRAAGAAGRGGKDKDKDKDGEAVERLFDEHKPRTAKPAAPAPARDADQIPEESTR